MLSIPEKLFLYAGGSLNNIETPAIRHRYQGREVYSFRENRNLLLTQYSLVARREKDGDVFRPSGFTGENHLLQTEVQ